MPIILSGCSVPGGLCWFVAEVLLVSLAATAGAWVLLVEVVRDERYRPVDEQVAEPAERTTA